MVSEVVGQEELEQNLGIKITKKIEDPKSGSVILHASGKKYDTLRQNFVDFTAKWLKDRKGWRAVLFYLGLGGFAIIIIKDAPALIPLLFLLPFVYLQAEIFAYFIGKPQRRPILKLFIKWVEKAFTLMNEKGKRIKVATFAPEVEGWDMDWLYEEAISDSARPGGVVIPEMLTLPNIRTGARMGFIEHQSDDGKFAMSSSHMKMSNYFLLQAYQKPKVFLSKDYLDFMNVVDEVPGTDPEAIARMKDRHRRLMKIIGEASTLWYYQEKDVKAHRKGLKDIGSLEFRYQDLLARYDKASDPVYEDLKERMERPEHVRKNFYIQLANKFEQGYFGSLALTDAYSLLKFEARMEEHQMQQDILEPDYAAAKKAQKVDMEKTGAPKSPDLLQDVKEAYEEEEENGGED